MEVINRRSVERRREMKLEAMEAQAKQTNEESRVVFCGAVDKGLIDENAIVRNADRLDGWKEGTEYKKGNIRRGPDGLVYKCLNAHKSQKGWEPERAPSLWGKIGNPADEFPEWYQPHGWAHNVGDKVAHNGKKWISTVPNNVWEPGIYGWDEVQ